MKQSADSEPVISSPCISVCLLNEQSICLGCFRTADEIARWTQYSEQQRREIIDQLGQRSSLSGLG